MPRRDPFTNLKNSYSGGIAAQEACRVVDEGKADAVLQSLRDQEAKLAEQMRVIQFRIDLIEEARKPLDT